ncbi:putative Microtubule-associated protein 1A [Paratrimastix pyriformis]|uniref:Microtubule-associated protein 1A n=1 Tax=Paratrimastix pyriformis TaxID=342808 RepID=A0ABQ8UN32_9EUKA|nr:putative Microtubule-associated protein 1A [Paratrimastix pyriformis]
MVLDCEAGLTPWSRNFVENTPKMTSQRPFSLMPCVTETRSRNRKPHLLMDYSSGMGETTFQFWAVVGQFFLPHPQGATKRLFLQSQTPFGVLHNRGQALGIWPCPAVGSGAGHSYTCPIASRPISPALNCLRILPRLGERTHVIDWFSFYTKLLLDPENFEPPTFTGPLNLNSWVAFDDREQKRDHLMEIMLAVPMQTAPMRITAATPAFGFVRPPPRLQNKILVLNGMSKSGKSSTLKIAARMLQDKTSAELATTPWRRVYYFRDATDPVLGFKNASEKLQPQFWTPPCLFILDQYEDSDLLHGLVSGFAGKRGFFFLLCSSSNFHWPSRVGAGFAAVDLPPRRTAEGTARTRSIGVVFVRPSACRHQRCSARRIRRHTCRIRRHTRRIQRHTRRIQRHTRRIRRHTRRIQRHTRRIQRHTRRIQRHTRRIRRHTRRIRRHTRRIRRHTRRIRRHTRRIRRHTRRIRRHTRRIRRHTRRIRRHTRIQRCTRRIRRHTRRIQRHTRRIQRHTRRIRRHTRRIRRHTRRIQRHTRRIRRHTRRIRRCTRRIRRCTRRIRRHTRRIQRHTRRIRRCTRRIRRHTRRIRRHTRRIRRHTRRIRRHTAASGATPAASGATPAASSATPAASGAAPDAVDPDPTTRYPPFSSEEWNCDKPVVVSTSPLVGKPPPSLGDMFLYSNGIIGVALISSVGSQPSQCTARMKQFLTQSDRDLVRRHEFLQGDNCHRRRANIEWLVQRRTISLTLPTGASVDTRFIVPAASGQDARLGCPFFAQLYMKALDHLPVASSEVAEIDASLLPWDGYPDVQGRLCEGRHLPIGQVARGSCSGSPSARSTLRNLPGAVPESSPEQFRTRIRCPFLCPGTSIWCRSIPATPSSTSSGYTLLPLVPLLPRSLSRPLKLGSPPDPEPLEPQVILLVDQITVSRIADHQNSLKWICSKECATVIEGILKAYRCDPGRLRKVFVFIAPDPPAAQQLLLPEDLQQAIGAKGWEVWWSALQPFISPKPTSRGASCAIKILAAPSFVAEIEATDDTQLMNINAEQLRTFAAAKAQAGQAQQIAAALREDNAYEVLMKKFTVDQLRPFAVAKGLMVPKRKADLVTILIRNARPD